jgi:hypothetical protein
MSTANEALVAIGDVSFTVSYAVAAEIRASAIVGGVSDYELIAGVLLIAILLAATPSITQRAYRTVALGWRHARLRGTSDGVWRMRVRRLLDWVLLGDDDERREGPTTRSLVAFVTLLFATGQRIAISLLVQVVAATAVSNQTLRIDRVLTLLSVAVFFIFLQSGASAVNAVRA